MRTSTTPARGAKFRPDIQGVRALAVGLVVLGHAGVPGLTGGFVGVDVFFVISGLLITSLLMDDAAGGRVGFGEFYARRARRILPASTLVILVTGVASVIVFNPLRAREILVDCVWASLFAANIKFARDGTDYFRDDVVSPLQHYWSLAVEEQFYLAWPALVAVVVLGAHWSSRGHRTGGLPRARLALAFALVSAGSLVLSVRWTATDPTGAYFSTFTRAWELGVGALIATCIPWLHRVPQPIRTALTWVGLAGIGAAAVAFDETTPFPGTAALLPVLATGALLAGGLGDPRFGANRLLARQPLRFVGDISYSLYLWHWPVLIIGAEVLGHSPNPAQSALLVILAVVLSVASFYGVENRFRRPREHSERKPARSIVLWPVSLSLVLLMVFQGWPTTPDEAGAQFRSQTQASPATQGIPAGPAEVKASVLSARRGEPLPADLEPRVEGVTADLTNIGDCSGYNKTSNRVCQFGDPQGSRTLVLFGNSHAAAWLPALAANASSAGWQFFPIVKEACDYPLYVGAAGTDHQCHAWYVWAKDQIARIHPDLIVMNGYGTGENWDSAISLAISDLKPLAARTLMLADVPMSVQGRPVDCLAARDATLQTCNFPLHGSSVSNDEIQARIADEQGIDFLAVRDWFCFDGDCPLVIGNRVVYATLGHISRTYALHISRLLGPYLKLE